MYRIAQAPENGSAQASKFMTLMLVGGGLLAAYFFFQRYRKA